MLEGLYVAPPSLERIVCEDATRSSAIASPLSPFSPALAKVQLNILLYVTPSTTIGISKDYIGPDDHILIIDDFMANGKAVHGLINIIPFCEIF